MFLLVGRGEPDADARPALRDDRKAEATDVDALLVEVAGDVPGERGSIMFDNAFWGLGVSETLKNIARHPVARQAPQAVYVSRNPLNWLTHGIRTWAI
jgi:hypothetical protein